MLRLHAVGSMIAAAVAAPLLLAGPSLAGPPPVGVNCRTDGRIHGGGSVLAANAQRVVFEPAFRREICGPVPGGPADANNQPDSTARMVLYNAIGRPTGSPSGINGAHCRTDAFEGTDGYTQAQLALLRGAKPLSSDPLCLPFQGVTMPFEPSSPPFPANADAPLPVGIMGFPVAGSAIAVSYNLTATACGGTTPPSTIQLDALQASRLFGGDIFTFNDAALVAIQPPGSTLANCAFPVTRVGRSDASPTTQLFKSYLNKADGSRALCDGTTWGARTGPNGSNLPSGGSCSPVSYVSSDAAVVTSTAAQIGAVGYGDLPDWRTLAPQLGLAAIRNQTNDAYVSPQVATASNCAFTNAGLPAGGALGAVSLSGSAWSTDLPVTTNRFDVTFSGTGYPICAYTFALVRQGLSGGQFTGAVARLSDNQRRTLFSYLLFALSPSAQAQLTGSFYAPVPALILSAVRTGFTSAF